MRYLSSIRESWVEPFGDMRQELVFIGQGLNKEAIKTLDDCILSEEEALRGKDYWATLPDPFEPWSENSDGNNLPINLVYEIGVKLIVGDGFIVNG